MSNWRLRFGSYDLPSAFYPSDLSGGEDIQAQELARQPGASTQEGRTRPRTITITGGWYASSLTAWESARNQILANLTGTQNLWLGTDSFYFKDCQVVNWGQSTPADGQLWAEMGLLSVTFQAARYPELFDSVSNTPTLASTGGTVNYDSSKGSAPTYPTWTVTIGTGAAGVLTLANTTTKETCILAKPSGNFANGDVIVVSGLPGAITATLNGTPVVGLYDRRIPRLLPGNNVITLSHTGSVTIASLACSYPGRWL